MSKLVVVLTFLFALSSCSKKDKDTVKEYSFNFSNDTEGWQAYFSDYHVGKEDFYELSFAYSLLPEPLDTTVPALRISGNNHSDDLVSMIYRKFDGLQPNRTYAITFDIHLASNVSTNSFGIGGSPNLAIGAGGIPYAPTSTVDEEGLYRPNFSSALQSHLSNDTLKTLGTIGVGEDVTEYAMINRNNLNDPVKLTANSKGELWLMIGTDSGFEGITTLYYTSIKIKMQ